MVSVFLEHNFPRTKLITDTGCAKLQGYPDLVGCMSPSLPPRGEKYGDWDDWLTDLCYRPSEKPRRLCRKVCMVFLSCLLCH